MIAFVNGIVEDYSEEAVCMNDTPLARGEQSF